MFDYLAKFSKISKTFSRKLIILALHSIDPYKNSKTYIYMCVPNLIFSISPVCVCVCVCVLVAQSCLTLCDPMDCSLPGFSVPGILQARTLEWVAISFSTKTQ